MPSAHLSLASGQHVDVSAGDKVVLLARDEHGRSHRLVALDGAEDCGKLLIHAAPERVDLGRLIVDADDSNAIVRHRRRHEFALHVGGRGGCAPTPPTQISIITSQVTESHEERTACAASSRCGSPAACAAHHHGDHHLDGDGERTKSDTARTGSAGDRPHLLLVTAAVHSAEMRAAVAFAVCMCLCRGTNDDDDAQMNVSE
jgi:hypothetical protein